MVKLVSLKLSTGITVISKTANSIMSGTYQQKLRIFFYSAHADSKFVRILKQ